MTSCRCVDISQRTGDSVLKWFVVVRHWWPFHGVESKAINLRGALGKVAIVVNLNDKDDFWPHVQMKQLKMPKRKVRICCSVYPERCAEFTLGQNGSIWIYKTRKKVKVLPVLWSDDLLLWDCRGQHSTSLNCRWSLIGNTSKQRERYSCNGEWSWLSSLVSSECSILKSTILSKSRNTNSPEKSTRRSHRSRLQSNNSTTIPYFIKYCFTFVNVFN